MAVDVNAAPEHVFSICVGVRATRIPTDLQPSNQPPQGGFFIGSIQDNLTMTNRARFRAALSHADAAIAANNTMPTENPD
jgi:hypothetical protein